MAQTTYYVDGKVYVNGEDCVGRVTSFTPPAYTMKTTEVKYQGLAFDRRLTTGFSPMTMTLVFDAGTINPLDTNFAGNVMIEIRGILLKAGVALSNNASDRFIMKIQGQPQETDPSEVNGTDKASITYTVYVMVYEFFLDTGRIQHADAEQNILDLGGTDVLRNYRLA